MISTKITKRILIAIIDFIILSISLYISLSIRDLELKTRAEFLRIFYPFLIIIFSNILVFYIYGLYDKMSVKIYTELNKRIITSQVLSSIIGAIIFYSTSIFAIAPKTILIIYITISSILIFLFRKNIRLIIKSKNDIKLLIVGEGNELFELKEEILNNKILNIKKIDIINLSNDGGLDIYHKVKSRVEKEHFNMLAINMHHPHIKNSISLFYELLLERVNVVNFADLYEDIMGKVPLQNIDAGWFFSNLYNKNDSFYKSIKRFIDLSLGGVAFLISLIFYPFVYIGLKIQDGGSLFYISERIGKNNEVIEIYKFRSMTDKKKNEIDSRDKNEKNRLTKFGKFLRKTRIDELPQLMNVVNGEISLIGPRPETPELVREYSNQIAFYGIRHTVTPGLSGYAQIYQEQSKVPKFGVDTEATKEKLAYDIYYLKHRSLILDISLALKTIKNLIGRSGV